MTFSNTTDPGVSNDETQGFAFGSEWRNTANGKLWRCDDASAGAAVWTDVTLGETHPIDFHSDTSATGAQLDTLVGGGSADSLHGHDHNALTNYDITQHRIINDAGTSTIETWSASKVAAVTSTLAAGFVVKPPANTSTEGEGDITLSGEQTLNGLLTSASRVVVTDQTDPAENGIYVSAAGAWSRATDSDEDSEVSNGDLIYVTDIGSTKINCKYLLVTTDPITVGVTGQVWQETCPLDFGTTAGTATEGDDSRVPSQDENDALVGTNGTPSSVNKFVTNTDSRNTDARTPTAHTVASHSDTTATGAELEELTDGSETTLHSHAAPSVAHSATTGKTTDDHHSEAHTIASHSDTTATGAELGELTDGSETTLHSHASSGGADLWATLNANSATFPASDPAAASSRNAHPILAFDTTTAESVVFHEVLSNDYAAGDIVVDIDWVAASATTGGVTWGVEFERIADSGTDIDSDSFASQQTGNSDTNGTSGIVTRTSITLSQAQADSVAAGDAFRLRLQRVTGDGDDDMSGDAQVLRVIGRQ